jgi:hypothetical protein
MAVIQETAPAPASGAPRWRRFLTPWRSPADQPAWARPALLAIAGVAAVAYGWGMTAETIGIEASWHRLLAGPFAGDSGWLLPAAVAGALGVLITRRRRGRRDPLRAAVVLWGGWWLVLAVFFSAGTYLNPR